MVDMWGKYIDKEPLFYLQLSKNPKTVKYFHNIFLLSEKVYTLWRLAEVIRQVVIKTLNLYLMRIEDLKRGNDIL